jgi:NAD-dependent DNA ligase
MVQFVSPFVAARAARAAFEGSGARAEINNIEGCGEVVVETIADFFAEKHNEDVLDALLEYVTPLDFVRVYDASGVKRKAILPVRRRNSAMSVRAPRLGRAKMHAQPIAPRRDGKIQAVTIC